ncbi:MAG: hypothetical protein ABI425_05960 [Patescibacteria group bacterium]
MLKSLGLRKEFSLFLLIVTIGLVVRLFLAINLPIWADEAYSIWATQQSWISILNTSVDPVHPPGYYLFLKFWSLGGSHLIWFRLTSVIGFVINCVILWKFSILIYRKKFTALIPVLLYSFSGYFVIFDWQVRMYTLSLTFMFCALYLLQKKKIKSLLLINLISLFFDYACFWLVFGMMFIFSVQILFKKEQKPIILLAFIIPLGLFFEWFLLGSHLSSGILGIEWMAVYLKPTFNIPYFLGTHQNLYTTLPILLTSLWGMQLILLKQKKEDVLFFSLTLCGVSVYISTLIYSFISSKNVIFHLRSLEIVGLVLMLCMSYALVFFLEKKQYLFLIGVVTLVMINFFLVVNMHFSQPSKLVISYFPWKKVFQKIDKDSTSVVIQDISEPATPLLRWSLYYTISGKESLNFKPIKIVSKDEIDESISTCREFYRSFVMIYQCS